MAPHWKGRAFADGRAAEQKHKGTPEAESGVPFFTQKRRENAFFYFGKYFTKNGGCFIISLKKLHKKLLKLNAAVFVVIFPRLSNF